MEKMKKKVTLLFPENVYDYLELEADKRGLTVATLCRLIIFEMYNKEKK